MNECLNKLQSEPWGLTVVLCAVAGVALIIAATAALVRSFVRVAPDTVALLGDFHSRLATGSLQQVGPGWHYVGRRRDVVLRGWATQCIAREVAVSTGDGIELSVEVKVRFRTELERVYWSLSHGDPSPRQVVLDAIDAVVKDAGAHSGNWTPQGCRRLAETLRVSIFNRPGRWKGLDVEIKPPAFKGAQGGDATLPDAARATA